MRTNYRAIWSAYHGAEIPRDADGRAYEIHHINGDRSDNSVENLICVSIEEHFNIHLEQGDWTAAMMIAKRMGKTPEELSALQRGKRHSPATRQKLSEARKKNIAKGITSWNAGKGGYKLNVNRKGNRYMSKIGPSDVIFMRSFLTNKIDLPLERKNSNYICALTHWLREHHYPHLTIPAIKDVLQYKSWKEVELRVNTDYEILTPTGFQDFHGVRSHAVQGMVKLVLETGETLRCSLDHKVETSDGFKEVRGLKNGDAIRTDRGVSAVVTVDREVSSEVVYDPVEVANGNVYYSDGIVSHNCEFLSSDALLISSMKLATLKATHHMHENMGFRFWTDKIGGRGKYYLVGIDPATGSGSDFTVIQVVEFPSLTQVGELRLNTVNIPLIYSKIKWLLRYLRTPAPNGGGRSEVLWSFERNGVGEALVAMIQNDDGRDGGVYIDGVELFSEDEKNYNRLGCYTSGRSKLLSCMQLKGMVERTNGLKLHSDKLLFELSNFVASGGSYQGKTGTTDDCVMAMLVIMKLIGRMAAYDDKARKLVYENVAPDSDEEIDTFGDEPVGLLI